MTYRVRLHLRCDDSDNKQHTKYNIDRDDGNDTFRVSPIYRRIVKPCTIRNRCICRFIWNVCWDIFLQALHKTKWYACQ